MRDRPNSRVVTAANDQHGTQDEMGPAGFVFATAISVAIGYVGILALRTFYQSISLLAYF